MFLLLPCITCFTWFGFVYIIYISNKFAIVIWFKHAYLSQDMIKDRAEWKDVFSPLHGEP